MVFSSHVQAHQGPAGAGNEELRKKVALLEDTVRHLITQPQVPQLVPIPVPVPCPCPPAPATEPWRVVPYQPYQPYQPPIWPVAPQEPIFPHNPRWPLVPDIICNAPMSETLSSCAIH